MLRLILVATSSLILFGCETRSESEVFGYSSPAEVNSFLTDQYFEIPGNDQRLADFSYQLLDRKRQRFQENRGRVVFLNFWATWCLPCKKEMPDIEELHRLMKHEDFRILAVNLGEKESVVAKFAERHGYTFDIIVDEKKSIASELQITGLPTTFILDKNGRILGKVMGPKKWNDPAFMDFFKQISH